MGNSNSNRASASDEGSDLPPLPSEISDDVVKAIVCDDVAGLQAAARIGRLEHFDYNDPTTDEPLLALALRCGSAATASYLVPAPQAPDVPVPACLTPRTLHLEWQAERYAPKPTSVLDVCAWTGNVDALHACISAGARPRSDDLTIQMVAAYAGHAACLVALHERWPDETVRSLGQTVHLLLPLHVAAGRGHVFVVHVLLRLGAHAIAGMNGQWTKSHGSPLHAVARGLDYWYDSHEIDQSMRSVRGRNLEMLHDYMSLAAVRVTPRAASALPKPSKSEVVVTIINALVDAGLDVNDASCGSDETPLMIAARFGNTVAARELLRHGASATARDAHGNNLYHFLVIGAGAVAKEALQTAIAAGASEEVTNEDLLRMCDILDAHRRGAATSTDPAEV